MATVFDKILNTTTGPKSYNWYRNKVSTMTTPGAKSLISKGKATLRPKYGIMNLLVMTLNTKIDYLTMIRFL